MTTQATNSFRVSLAEFIKQELHDERNRIFSDAQYDIYVRQALDFGGAHYTTPVTLTARRMGSTGSDFRWLPPRRRTDMVMWGVTAVPDSGVEVAINEPANTLQVQKGTHSADTMSVSGWPVGLGEVRYVVLRAIANNAAARAAYVQTNGLVMDARQAADIIMQQASVALGVV